MTKQDYLKSFLAVPRRRTAVDLKLRKSLYRSGILKRKIRKSNWMISIKRATVADVVAGETD
ncbi:hypothetical protein [Desulfosediminicola sp.]|uniref:hypothetical protein n=1 Tax=Desulfosediminicola sp. TaxID=2886825 RepID=UPI003AF28558